MSFSLVGTQWNLAGFEKYLSKTDTGWSDSVTIHHTGFPDLAMRKKGLTAQHIRNIRDYYKGKGWSGGPHLFIDDLDISGMNPLNERGVHARSFNSKSIGIEVLGNYDNEDPKSGRGWECWKLTAKVVAAILNAKGLPATKATILFHRDDPKTSKTCPGNKIEKVWFIALVKGEMEGKPDQPDEPEDECDEHLKGIAWQVEQIKKEFQTMDDESLEKRLGFIEWRAKQLCLRTAVN